MIIKLSLISIFVIKIDNNFQLILRKFSKIK